MSENIIACAGALIFRLSEAGALGIHLQFRVIQTPGYDLMYDQTWETAAGGIGPDDSGPVAAAMREALEECGLDQSHIVEILGEGGQQSERKGELIHDCEPFFCSYQQQGPHPWFTVFFAVQVDSTWKPTSGDGEATAFRWVSPKDLLTEIDKDPTSFFGPHRLALQRLATYLLQGLIAPRSPSD